MDSQEYEKRGRLSEDFRLFHIRDMRLGEIDYHYHEFHKLVFFISGSASYVVEGKRYILEPGDVVIVGRGAVHRPEVGSGLPYERIILYISPEFLQENSSSECELESCFLASSARGNHVLRSDGRMREIISDRLSELERECTGSEFGHSLMSKSLLIQLIISIIRGTESMTLHYASTELYDEKIVSILAYLNDNISSDISIEALAERFYISKYHMMRRFREETGFSIYSYILEKRLLLARDLIHGGCSATEACFRCGYKSYSAFFRAYRKLFGTTPLGRNGV